MKLGLEFSFLLEVKCLQDLKILECVNLKCFTNAQKMILLTLPDVV